MGLLDAKKGRYSLKKKLQVFISSTYIDLIEERQSAVQAVLDAGHIPAGMELFKAGNRTQLETIYKWINDSDVYMLILGGRYGSIEEDSQKSYTHLEYEYAINIGKPIFAVVLNDSFLNAKTEILDEKSVFEVDNKQKYNDFKSVVMSRIIRIANDPKDIMLAIHTTLNDFLEEYDLIGWVRRDNTEVSVSLLTQTNDLNLRIQSLEEKNRLLKEELNQFKISFDESLAFEGHEILIEGSYEERHGNRPGTYSYRKRDIHKHITWDNMFLLWAPRLLQTLNATMARKELERALKDYMGRYFSINDNQFNIIKIQYHALGLINVYEARTTSGGTAEFISLTSKGKNYLVQYSAIKKQ
ncbi:DUF4062 domain-containing protein [Paenibacillus terreus]|uniref:DUF4062 domain-containing protein n=1 Tax=Paenibacillus terreus TaxID=1387834 RepID=A0ABV5BFY5_9BACL